MDAEYICVHLRKLITLQLRSGENGTFARLDEEGYYVFGKRKPFVRNRVSRQVAIYLVSNNLLNIEK